MNNKTLSTLLCEVERILNDMPLTSLNKHPDDPEPMTLRGLWPMGFSEEVFSDSNRIVRSMQVKTATSVYRGDIRKLCLLDEV